MAESSVINGYPWRPSPIGLSGLSLEIRIMADATCQHCYEWKCVASDYKTKSFWLSTLTIMATASISFFLLYIFPPVISDFPDFQTVLASFLIGCLILFFLTLFCVIRFFSDGVYIFLDKQGFLHYHKTTPHLVPQHGKYYWSEILDVANNQPRAEAVEITGHILYAAYRAKNSRLYHPIGRYTGWVLIGFVDFKDVMGGKQFGLRLQNWLATSTFAEFHVSPLDAFSLLAATDKPQDAIKTLHQIASLEQTIDTFRADLASTANLCHRFHGERNFLGERIHQTIRKIEEWKGFSKSKVGQMARIELQESLNCILPDFPEISPAPLLSDSNLNQDAQRRLDQLNQKLTQLNDPDAKPKPNHDRHGIAGRGGLTILI